MKNSNRGFTLIELLVVVLIIGILAGIALPQYRKAVMKARLAQLDIVVDTVKKNIQLYLNSNGWPSNGEKIWFSGSRNIGDIELPNCENDEEDCNNDIGSFQAKCLGEDDICYIDFVGNEKINNISLMLTIDKSVGNFWFVENVSSTEILCQWLKERGYPGNSDAIESCSNLESL